MRNTMILLCLFGALAVMGPAAALANGPSAGDQQYVDPLSGGTHHHHTTTTTTPTPTTTPAPAASPSSSSPTAAVTTTSAVSAGTTTGSGKGSKTLPFTGLDVSLAAAVGLLMLVLGAGMRRSLRRRA